MGDCFINPTPLIRELKRKIWVSVSRSRSLRKNYDSPHYYHSKSTLDNDYLFTQRLVRMATPARSPASLIPLTSTSKIRSKENNAVMGRSAARMLI